MNARGRRSPRLAPGRREQAIVSAATEFFAEHGLHGSTRGLAARLGVTQALLYRYFPSKQALVERVFADLFLRGWDPRWTATLLDRDRPLAERLTVFYGDYCRRIEPAAIRLFVRAGLEGLAVPGRHGAALTERIFEPVIAELRHAARLPELRRVPMTRGERECAMMLHAAVVFLAIREHVYRMSMPDDLDDVIALYARTFVAGAPATLRALHAGDDAGLRVRQLVPPPASGTGATARPPRESRQRKS